MDSYGIKNVGGHFLFQERVMTKGKLILSIAAMYDSIIICGSVFFQ